MDVIVHHWDTDGICSAALIAMELEQSGIEWVNYSPPIGEFMVSDRIHEAISQADLSSCPYGQ